MAESSNECATIFRPTENYVYHRSELERYIKQCRQTPWTNWKSVFWDVMLCSLVNVYQRFGKTCCRHLQDWRLSQASRNLLGLLLDLEDWVITVITFLWKSANLWLMQLSRHINNVHNLIQISFPQEGLWVLLCQINNWSDILHLSDTGEKMRVQWNGTAAIHSLQKSLLFS
jgi:hypothetical protein